MITFSLFTKSSLAQNTPVKQWAFNDKSTLHNPAGGPDSGEDWFYTGIQTSDGGFLGAGYTELNPASHAYSIAVVKLNNLGKRIWERFFNVSAVDNDYAVEMIESSNGHYIILANIGDGNTLIPYYEILEYDKDGNLIQQKPIKDASNIFHGGGYGSIRKVIDGGTQVGYIIGCADLSTAPAHDQKNAHATLIRLDNNFNLVTTFGTGGIASYSNTGSNCRTASVLHNLNGTLAGFLLVGRVSTGTGGNDFDALAIRTSIDGNTIGWSQQYNESSLGGYVDAFSANQMCTCTTAVGVSDACPEFTNREVGFSGEEISNGGNIILDLWFDYKTAQPPQGCFNTWVGTQSWQDLDVALLRIDASTGALTGTVQTKDVAHFSGIDFWTPMKINIDGFIYLTGNDASDPNYIKMRLLKIDPTNFNTIWDRNFLSDENISYTDNQVPITTLNKYHANCVFGMDVSIDGGILLSGNNAANDEDYMMVKIAPDCQRNITYTGVGDISGGKTLTTNETWSSSRKIQGTVTVPAGKTLTITGASTVIKFADSWRTVDFDKLATNTFNFATIDQPTKIVVEIGGSLIIDNGATLRGMDACGFSDGDMWEGVQVTGTPSAHYQNVSSSGNLLMQNSAKIQDARCGILVDKGTYNVNGNLEATNSFGGGIVTISDAQIKNCRFGLVFSPYVSIYSSYVNPSRITSTTFICNAPLSDEIYVDGNGTRQGTSSFCKIYLQKGLHFQSCDFEGYSLLSDPTQRGTGIGAYDSGFNVEDYTSTNHSKFNNLALGIVSGTSGSGLNGSILIENAEFGMNHSSAPTGSNFQSIYLVGSGIYTSVRNNYFLVPSINKAFGINYEGCTSFECKDNIFLGGGTVNSSTNFGVIVSSSFDNDNIVYRNSFDNISHSSTALFYNGNSTGLQFKCNTYNSLSGNDIEMVSQSVVSTINSPGTVRIHQGDICTFNPFNANYYTGPAGNIFSNLCNNSNRIYLDPTAQSQPQITYHYNNNSYFPGSNPTCISNTVLTQNCNVSYNQNNFPCAPPTIVGNPCSKPPYCVPEFEAAVQAQINSMNSLVDGGKTDQMLNDISNPNVSSATLKNQLENSGPYLSDEVLQAAVERPVSMANGDLKDVVLQNSPLNDDIYETLLDTKPIIAGNVDVVNKQMINQSPRDVLEMQIGELKGAKRQAAMKLVEYYMTDSSVPYDDSAASFLLTTNYKLDAIGMLASIGDYTNAQSLLNSYEPTSQEELNEKLLMNMYLPLIAIGKKWDALDVTQLNQVKQLAEGIGPAASRAKTVLSILGMGDLVPQIPVYNIHSTRLAASPKRKYNITNYFTFNDEADLNISPNPTGSQTELTYRFPSPPAKPFLIISDMNGRQILSKSISSNENKLTIETAGIQPGVYHVQLMDGRSLLKSMPLVIIK